MKNAFIKIDFHLRNEKGYIEQIKIVFFYHNININKSAYGEDVNIYNYYGTKTFLIMSN